MPVHSFPETELCPEMSLALPTVGADGVFDWSDTLRVGPSTVRGAGDGVFAARDLPGMMHIPYFGRVGPRAMNKGSHAAGNPHTGQQVDAYEYEPQRANIAGRINEPSSGMPNVFGLAIPPDGDEVMPFMRMFREFESEHGVDCASVFCITDRDISAGDELFTYYGNEYGERPYALSPELVKWIESKPLRDTALE